MKKRILKKKDYMMKAIRPATLKEVRTLTQWDLLPEETECHYCQDNWKCKFCYDARNIGRCIAEESVSPQVPNYSLAH